MTANDPELVSNNRETQVVVESQALGEESSFTCVGDNVSNIGQFPEPPVVVSVANNAPEIQEDLEGQKNISTFGDVCYVKGNIFFFLIKY